MGIGMRLGQSQSDDHGFVRSLRIQRLPRISQRALPEVALETIGDTVPVSLSLNSLSVQYCTDICAGKFYNYHIELHTFRLCFFLCVNLKKMNLFDHRLAATLQIRTVLAARMFELRDLRRRVQTAQLNPRRRRRARSKTALFKSLDAESIDRPQRVGLAKWRVRCGRRLRPRLK